MQRLMERISLTDVKILDMTYGNLRKIAIVQAMTIQVKVFKTKELQQQI